VQDDFVFLVGDLAAGERVCPVGVGNRFPLDPGLFAGDRDLHGLLFGDNVFPEPGPAGFDLLRADPEVFLGSGHRLVGVRAGSGIPRPPPIPGITRGGGLLIAAGPGGAGAGGAEVPLVVGVQGLLFIDVQVTGVGDVGGVLDHRLVERQDQVVTVEAGSGEWGEVLLHSEQAGVDGDPVRLPGFVVEVDLADGADLIALRSTAFRPTYMSGDAGLVMLLLAMEPLPVRAAGTGLRAYWAACWTVSLES
jgi:hypothetical protein